MNQNKIQRTRNKIEKIEYPKDKVNNFFWNSSEEEQHSDDPMSFKLGEKGRKKNNNQTRKEILAYVKLDFNKLKIDMSKTIDAFDKRVYCAIGSLYYEGIEYFSLSQVFYAMGGIANPKHDQLQKIYKSIEKMSLTKIWMQANTGFDESDADYIEIEDYLLPMESTNRYRNKRHIESIIHITKMPLLFKWAMDLNQITSFPVDILQTPISQTTVNLTLEDYFLQMICWKKYKKEKCFKLTYRKIYDRLKITTQKQEKRTLEKIERLLDYYATCKFIKNYEMQQDGVYIYL